MIDVRVCDARAMPWPDGFFHACITSPPYFGLRKYGTKPGEIGKESLPSAYIASMVAVGREVRRVLRDDGTWWLNLGDTYTGDKQLQLIPARVAIALRNDGWIIRSEIPWLRRNAMPNSQRDRPSVGHETIYLMSKSTSYFFDLNAVRRGWADERNGASGATRSKFNQDGAGRRDGGVTNAPKTDGRAWRTTDPAFDSIADLRAYLEHVATFETKGGVLTSPEGDAVALYVNTQPSKLRHFAMWPPRLVAEMVSASTSVGGRVLDPFSGAGTTVAVADFFGRDGYGCELIPENVELSEARRSEVQRALKDWPQTGLR